MKDQIYMPEYDSGIMPFPRHVSDVRLKDLLSNILTDVSEKSIRTPAA